MAISNPSDLVKEFQFVWCKRSDTGKGHPYTEAEKEAAITFIEGKLAGGKASRNIICYHMIPRLPKRTLEDWCTANPEFARRIDEAYEAGSDLLALSKLANAEGSERKDVKVNRFINQERDKLLQHWNARYKNRTLVGSDPDNPLPQGSTHSTWIVNTVAPDPKTPDDA